eukprot:1496522-Rhodomonas_salina.3
MSTGPEISILKRAPSAGSPRASMHCRKKVAGVPATACVSPRPVAEHLRARSAHGTALTTWGAVRRSRLGPTAYPELYEGASVHRRSALHGMQTTSRDAKPRLTHASACSGAGAYGDVEVVGGVEHHAGTPSRRRLRARQIDLGPRQRRIALTSLQTPCRQPVQVQIPEQLNAPCSENQVCGHTDTATEGQEERTRYR